MTRCCCIAMRNGFVILAGAANSFERVVVGNPFGAVAGSDFPPS
jgi:hypothetical protein